MPSAFCLLTAYFLLPGLAFAATTNRWTNSVSGLWRVATNWSSNSPPNSTYTWIAITNAGAKTVSLDAATAASNLTVNSLVVSAPIGATNLLWVADLTNGPLDVLNTLNVDSRGQVLVTNATLQVDSACDVTAGELTLQSGAINCPNITVRVGRSSSPVGSLTLNGGTLQAFKLSVASAASSGATVLGNCTVAGGTLISSSLLSLGAVGSGSGSTGFVTVSAGQLIATNDISGVGIFSAEVGVQGRGHMTVSGGAATFTSLSVGYNAIGSLDVTGGQLTVIPRTTNDWMQISGGDNARFNMSGGVVLLGSEFHIADSATHTGTVSIVGGQLIATNDLTAIGRYGPGFLTISNATVTLTNVSVGRHDDSVGTLTLQTGGTLYCLDALSIGRFNEGNGTPAVGHMYLADGLLSITNDTIFVGREGAGDLTVTNGTVRARSLFIGMSPDGVNAPTGTATLMGGQTLLSSNLVIGTAALSSGQLTVGGGNLTVTNAAGSASLQVANGTVTLNQGTITADLVAVTNNSGRLAFNGGTLESKGTTVANGLPFVVGDGIKPATFRLLGGTHAFADGLVINTNATLTGCGTIIGAFTNYGTLATNCAGPSDPSITQQPTNQTALVGGSAMFTVTASGTAPLSYQWRFNNNDVSDATNSSLTLTNVQTTNAGSYQVVVTNTSGAITSAVAVLNVLVAPQITSITVTGTNVTVSFTTVSGSNHTLEYKNLLEVTTWTSLPPAVVGTGGIMTKTDTNALTDTRFYRVRVE